MVATGATEPCLTQEPCALHQTEPCEVSSEALIELREMTAGQATGQASRQAPKQTTLAALAERKRSLPQINNVVVPAATVLDAHVAMTAENPVIGISLEEKVKRLLIKGFTQEQAATTAGCTASYVSQLMKEPQFRNEVDSARFLLISQKADKFEEMDDTADDIEHEILKKLKNMLPMIQKPEQALAMYRELNKAKRRRDTMPGQGQATDAGSGNVTVTLPTHLLQKLGTVGAVTIGLTSANEISTVSERVINDDGSEASREITINPANRAMLAAAADAPALVKQGRLSIADALDAMDGAGG